MKNNYWVDVAIVLMNVVLNLFADINGLHRLVVIQ